MSTMREKERGWMAWDFLKSRFRINTWPSIALFWLVKATKLYGEPEESYCWRLGYRNRQRIWTCFFFSIWLCRKNESWHTYTQWAYYKFWLCKEWGHIIYRYNKTYTTYYLYHIVNWTLHNVQLTFSGTITLICKKPVATIENWTASLWIWVDDFHQRTRQSCVSELRSLLRGGSEYLLCWISNFWIADNLLSFSWMPLATLKGRDKRCLCVYSASLTLSPSLS